MDYPRSRVESQLYLSVEPSSPPVQMDKGAEEGGIRIKILNLLPDVVSVTENPAMQ